MSGAVFGRRAQSIPVSVVVAGAGGLPAGAAIVRLGVVGHDHGMGAACPACASQSDVRALLFELLESERQGLSAPLTRVVVTVQREDDLAGVADALTPGKTRASGLRDHTVARSFHLA